MQCKTSHLRPCHVPQCNQRNYGVSGSRILIQQRNQGVLSADIESVEDQGAGHSPIKQSSCVPGIPAPPAPLLPPRSGIARIEERRGRTAWHETQLLLFDEVTNFRHLVPRRTTGLLPDTLLDRFLDRLPFLLSHFAMCTCNSVDLAQKGRSRKNL